MASPSRPGATEYDTFLALAQIPYEELWGIVMLEVPSSAVWPGSEYRPQIERILRKHHWHWFDFWDEYRFRTTGIPRCI